MKDADECLNLLEGEKNLLKKILSGAENDFAQVSQKTELAMFLYSHGWNIYEMAKAATMLMRAGEPFATAVLARSALESTFNMIAASNDKAFGAQKIAHELEEMADKLDFFIKSGCWNPSRKPSSKDCRQEAERIRVKYKVEPKKWKSIEQIAQLADLSPYYDDDYRFLSLQIHANQFGIHNSATGFLTRKGGLALANAMFIASNNLTAVFRLGRKFDKELQEIRTRLEAMMNRPDALPPSHSDQSSFSN